MRASLVTPLVLLVACGGAAPPAAAPTPPAPAPAPDAAPAAPPRPVDESAYAPLDAGEIGADYATYRKLTPEPFLSRVHGDRWVDVYVSEAGADAYLDGSPIPVGTTVVKTSWEDDGGKPGPVAGPIYIMRKEPPGYAPEHDDWYYAIHWAEPTPAQRAKLGGPIYWRGGSPRVAYCYDCHDNYDRSLGGLTPSSIIYR
jgi:hypothetical protein